MAIPFNLPSYEETENNYRAMDELLAQLYSVLRQILLRRHLQVPVPSNIDNHSRTDGRVNSHRQQQPQQQVHVEVEMDVDAPLPPAAAGALPDVVPRLPLPDVVPRLPQPDVVSCCCHHTTTAPAQPDSRRPPPPRRPRRRTHKQAPQLKVEVRDNWTQVGEELRHFADEFASTKEPDPKTLQDSFSHNKGLGFLSLLVPPFRGTVCMAVIFLFGWQALQRAR